MKETHSSGLKEFFFAILWSIILLYIGSFIVSAFSSYKFAGAVITLILFCVLGFYVLTRSCAVFTYEITGSSLRVNRMIGKRNKEIEFRYEDIISISKSAEKDLPKPQYNMRTSIISRKKCTYIVFGYTGNKQTLIFEPSDEFMKELKRSIKESKKLNG